MSELYLIFFAVGLLVFGAIVAYSIYQKRRLAPQEKKAYVDPLFAELEETKNKEVPNRDAKNKAGSSKGAKTKAASAKEAKQVGSTLGMSGEIAKRGSDANLQSGAQESVDVGEKARQAPVLSQNVKQQTIEEPNVVEQGVISQSTNDENLNSLSEAQKSALKPNKEAPTLRNDQSEANSDPALEKKTATVHKAELAPDPKQDQYSSSIVTELVARIKNPEPIEQQGLLSLFRKHDFNFHRKVHIYGLNELTDMWRDIEFELSSARFTELGVSIQLADREGAMSQKELHDFQQMVLEFTNVYDAPFEFSMGIDDALKQALALDQIGRRYDSMAVLNVVPKSKAGFRMADIESCARDLMMSTDKNGIFMKTLGSKNNILVLFRLACTDGSGQFGVSTSAASPVHDLVVYMNVPATKDPEMVFQEMVKDANSLATWLDGKVVDRNGRVMTQRSYSMLMQQVSDIAFSMQQDGFTPGDAVAKKLF